MMNIHNLPIIAKVLLAEHVAEGERIREGAYSQFDALQIGDRVETTKGYPKACGSLSFRGVVVGKEILPDQEENQEKYPFLYAQTNPYVVIVKTDAGEKHINIIWLRKLRITKKSHCIPIKFW